MSRSVVMTALDRRAVFALTGVRGLSPNAQRIVEELAKAARIPLPISLRQRHALHAICWRFRRQLPTRLLVPITLALAEAKAAAEEARLEAPGPERIRGYRTQADGPRTNPLNDLFPEAVAR